MRSFISALARFVVLVLVVLAVVPVVEAADREKLLSEPGIYVPLPPLVSMRIGGNRIRQCASLS